jgi:hypothetical protein
MAHQRNRTYTPLIFDYPSSLLRDESFEITYGPFFAGECWQTNTASVSGVFENNIWL